MVPKERVKDGVGVNVIGISYLGVEGWTSRQKIGTEITDGTAKRKLRRDSPPCWLQWPPASAPSGHLTLSGPQTEATTFSPHQLLLTLSPSQEWPWLFSVRFGTSSVLNVSSQPPCPPGMTPR